MNPNVVSRLGADFISAQQHVRVAATAKHFPGLGAAAASQNTDAQPVTLNLAAATIRGPSMVPLPGGGHRRRQAGLWCRGRCTRRWARSARPGCPVIGGELRTRLGFKGVTITDALEAPARCGRSAPPRTAPGWRPGPAWT